MHFFSASSQPLGTLASAEGIEHLHILEMANVPQLIADADTFFVHNCLACLEGQRLPQQINSLLYAIAYVL
ncbi:MAG TPA: hypothetical protein DCP92_08520 [Nitrospiraceae bacterium]|nr:hypothetical protein [Nitrospiraceae bacterium]